MILSPNNLLIMAMPCPYCGQRTAGIYRTGKIQIKIYSKIMQMDDGWVYFASMDETGERADGSQLPQCCSHFWRYKPSADHREHLFSSPEGLVAVSGASRRVCVPGCWGHSPYPYDTLSGKARQIRADSEGGHISRHFVANKDGHACVPKVRYFDL